MSLLAATMLEPHVCKDGTIALTAVSEGSIEEIHGPQLYGAKAGKDEIAIYEDLTANRWPLPHHIKTDWEGDLKTLSEIETNIMRYLRRYVWLRDTRQYALIADWVISTYFRNQFYYAPLLIFDGLTTSGKSTAIYALSQICYRGELFDSASGPAIAREIEDYGSTILLDEVLDSLAGDRGQDLFTMMKSAFGKEGTWVRADPKGRKNYRYRTYTHIALSIKGDTLPEDLYNRAIRINMTAAPSNIDLADVYNWKDDDHGRDDSPDTIRTDLYRLKAYSTAWPAGSDHPVAKRSVSFTLPRLQANRDVTLRTEDGQWLYAYAHGLPDDSPTIRARDRNIANTLYAVGLATGSAGDVIALIVDNATAQRETILDTPEALTFVAMLELVEERWAPFKGVGGSTLRLEQFRAYMRDINTSDIAQRYNEILADQGNAGREPIPTKTVTAKLNAMGFAYGRSGGHGGNKSWMKPDDPYFAGLFLRYLKTFCPERVADFNGISVNKPEKS